MEIAFLNPLGLSLIPLTVIEQYKKQARAATDEMEKMDKLLEKEKERALQAEEKLIRQFEDFSGTVLQKLDGLIKKLAEAKARADVAARLLQEADAIFNATEGAAAQPDDATAAAATALAPVDLNGDDWTRIKADLLRTQAEEAAAKKAERGFQTVGRVRHQHHHQQQRAKPRRLEGNRRGS